MPKKNQPCVYSDSYESISSLTIPPTPMYNNPGATPLSNLCLRMFPALTSSLFLAASQDPRDLKPSAKCLIKEQSRLELRDKWEPCQHRHRDEDDDPHQVFVPP